jgi:glycosyltransferase involved in cell wall biosynthesis
MSARGLRVALVHDWLTGMRGGERVLEALCETFPQADVHTLLLVPGAVSSTIERRVRATSLVQHLPAAARLYRHYLPLFPFAVEQFDLDGYDLIISSSHCAAKAVIVPGRARHLCYCHSPMRYAWDQFDAYFGEERIGDLAARVLRRYMRHLARWDAETAPRVHAFVANSQYVAGRIRRYYNRVASVVHPPVDTDFFTPDGRSPGDYFLVVSALVPYKRLDLAIAAAEATRRPLKIVGRGPERARLERLAQSSTARVEFLGSRTNDEIRDLYRSAAAVLMPGEEDFGMVPVEAQACGRPVVAFARGGALETVVDGVTGVLVHDASVSAFADALGAAAAHTWDAATLRAHALRFAKQPFVDGMLKAVGDMSAGLDPDFDGGRAGARDLSPEHQHPEQKLRV